MNTAAEKEEKRIAIFISDLHLGESTPETTRAFLDFMADAAKRTERLYILGDLFEYWAGDDDIENPVNRPVTDAIRQLCRAGVAVFWIPGNRDFLAGSKFAEESGARALPDLHEITIGNRKIALAHGDAQCLEDPDYVSFRAMVRNPRWQEQFLSMPLEKRKLVIESFRKDSRKENEGKAQSLQDVSPSAVEEVFTGTGAAVFIHGHTHRPGVHDHGSCKRYVLPDWDRDGAVKKGGWLELTADGSFLSRTLSP